MSTTLDILILGTACLHVLLTPYTKVEESFNLHATHDIIMYGIGSERLSHYDHFVFPGAVPRSFIGSLILAWLSRPLVGLASSFGWITTKLDIQILVRLVLTTLNALMLCLIRRSVSRRFGRLTGLYFAIITCSQFHLPFWMGRTLPNMFALVPVNLATYLLLSRAPNSTKPSYWITHLAIGLLTSTAVILRSEVLLLLAPIVLQALVSGYTTFASIVRVGVTAGLVSLALTVLVDSYFWQRWPLWPELAGIYFNVYEGKSAEWGVSPPHTYFTSFLPRLLLSALPLSLIGALIDGRIRELLFAPLVFVGLISALGHKEWRFVIYVVPAFNVAAARGARWLTGIRKGTIFGRMRFFIVMAMISANCAVTIIHTQASMANYPGGLALSAFNERYSSTDNVHVHISNLAAQTGASLFLHAHAPPYPPYLAPPRASHWTYNKTESLDAKSLTVSTRITHIIAESTSDFDLQRKWTLVDSVAGFDHWEKNFAVLKNGGGLKELLAIVTMAQIDKLYILERR
ncbi:glycosyltransferase family 22 protein [Neolentinus lepideus HHB14362 ss-1]|uniref:Mannosyltransferase n=1 Tax=Neolentinus lepideus HHB14362 ss-1 TaxID=1314782 RepID=A0A165R0C3_9AGAM|nr:glycosyltransferase family 22 protein [Neolentinus lepideus HHB14362 ss-1]